MIGASENESPYPFKERTGVSHLPQELDEFVDGESSLIDELAKEADSKL